MRVENVILINNEKEIFVTGDNMIIEGCTIGENENGLYLTNRD